MRRRATFFVEEGLLCTRLDGKVVPVMKWLRHFKGQKVTPIFPHVVNEYLVLVGSNRPIAVFPIYKNGDVKESLVEDDKEYHYEIVTAPLPAPKKKGPAL